MKKLLIVLTIFCIVLPSCKKTPVITLSVDKNEISANGIDVAKFRVICNDEDDVTKQARIFFADTNKELGAASFSTKVPDTYTFYATYDDAKSEIITVEAVDNNDENNAVVLKLTVDKTSILADGVDSAVFSVSADGTVLSDNYQILNVADNSFVANGVFTTTEAGVYTFVALYDKAVSNEIVVEAQVVEYPDPVVELKADKTSIAANGVDKVTFVVLVDGVDMTSESLIINQNSNETLNGNTFTSENAGEYVFKAEYNGFQSESVTITVNEVQVYSPGDLYDVDGVRGVVFYVENDGKSGLIMSMDQAFLQWSTENVWANCISQKGEWNTEDMLKLGEDKYPAAKWCVDHGEGWYMPSSYEMNIMWTAVSDGKHVFDNEFVKLYNDKLDDPILEDYYWSSNELSEDMAEVVVFIDNSVVCLDPSKSRYFHVRAIRKF